ncbi:alpha-1,3-arabinosyltransferase XAT2-like [Magnolia sinica]|uniref:alpha-1,3-arabinosyltransferase XAT2-like n=1 Tax=Magnolia sinica TaxID=86752 RepID=UPI0026586D79|nr:alpha-1,3-arabinosyltransferase XAT2-like [Magnolia sinica]
MAVQYDVRFIKSFGRYDQTKIGYGAIVGCLLISLSFLAVFRPYLSPRPIMNLRLSMGGDLSMLMIENKSGSPQLAGSAGAMRESKLICNITDPRSDLCEMDGEIRIRGNSSNIFIVPSQIGILAGNESWKIKPYARKGDEIAMRNVREFSLRSMVGNEESPNCTLNHGIPAVVFSIGGYTGNLFHDFTDVLVPLFVTSHQFHGEVQFLVTDSKSWWIKRYKPILKQLSRYEIIDFDRDRTIHCFEHTIVGLRSHKELSIDPSRSPNGYSMCDFRGFLRTTYSLKRTDAIKFDHHQEKKPRLLIISRKRSRSFTNEHEIVEMAQSLGYEVVATEANLGMNMSEFAQVVNSCDVMMGVHGAGLTNLVFLPTNAVLIQVVPLGGLEGFARLDFGVPAMDMKLRYMEYKIGEEESTLIEQFPRDHAIFRDPMSVKRKGWPALRSVYLDKQNVKLDVGRFKSTLLEALKLLHR